MPDSAIYWIFFGGIAFWLLLPLVEWVFDIDLPEALAALPVLPVAWAAFLIVLDFIADF